MLHCSESSVFYKEGKGFYLKDPKNQVWRKIKIKVQLQVIFD